MNQVGRAGTGGGASRGAGGTGDPTGASRVQVQPVSGCLPSKLQDAFFSSGTSFSLIEGASRGAGGTPARGLSDPRADSVRLSHEEAGPSSETLRFYNLWQVYSSVFSPSFSPIMKRCVYIICSYKIV